MHSFDLLRVLTGLEADRVTCLTEQVQTRRTEDNFVASICPGGISIRKRDPKILDIA